MFRCCYKHDDAAEELIVGPPVFNDDQGSRLTSRPSFIEGSKLRKAIQQFINAASGEGVPVQLHSADGSAQAGMLRLTPHTLSVQAGETDTTINMDAIKRLKQDGDVILIFGGPDHELRLSHDHPVVLFSALTLAADQSRTRT